MPKWVSSGIETYTKRMQGWSQIIWHEIPVSNVMKESQQIQQKLSTPAFSQHCKIALEVGGKSFSTEQFTHYIETQQMCFPHFVFVIGGPNGFDAQLKQWPGCQFHLSLSFSQMTLPHPIVRIFLSEQLYRTMSILKGHPYHK